MLQEDYLKELQRLLAASEDASSSNKVSITKAIFDVEQAFASMPLHSSSINFHLGT